MGQEHLTFEHCLAMDPRIAELLVEAGLAIAPKDKPFCANCIWYRRGGLKSRLVELVGLGRAEGPPQLQTSAAYDAVYHRCYEALPDCNHEGYLCGG